MTDREAVMGIKDDINTADVLPAVAQFDVLEAEAPAASVQQLPGAKWVKRYVGGGGVRQYPYAVWLRMAPKDTATRANGYAALMQLDGVAGEITSTPSLVTRDENGTEVWRAQYVKTVQESVVESTVS